MPFSVLRTLMISALTLLAACKVNPEDPAGAADRHDTAIRTHREFESDFENAGNEAMAQHHARQAELELEKKAEEQCDLLCTIIDSLLEDGKPETISGGGCRDPVTTPPSAPARC